MINSQYDSGLETANEDPNYLLKLQPSSQVKTAAVKDYTAQAEGGKASRRSPSRS